MTFDESYGYQKEEINANIVGKQEPRCEAIKKLAIGEVKPVKAQGQEEVKM